MQVMASLINIVPRRKLLEMSITGKTYTSEEALQIGLITQIVPKEIIKSEVDRLAELICANAPFAIKSGMGALQNITEMPENERHIFLKEQLDKILLSEDAKEGILAFKEKRNPVWKSK